MIEKSALEPWIARIVSGTGAPDIARLREWQLGRIQATIEHARARSPFYARHLSGVRIPQTLEELTNLPFTSQEDIRREGQRFLCVSQGDIARVVTLDTSGTSGPPKRFYFTKYDQELTVDFFHHGMSVFTRPGERVLILLPCHREGSVGDLLFTALQRLRAVPVRHGVVQSLAGTLKTMEAEGIDVVVGIPAQVNALARYASAAGSPAKLKSALLSTDHVPRAVSDNIAAQYACEVFGHYGMTEMGLGGGVECKAHAGYHAFAADIYFEVIDPVTLRPLPDGEYGEVVITTLRREGMPLIRYRTGDISRFLPGVCPCGSVIRRLERLTRRLDAGVQVGTDAWLNLCDMDEALFALPALLDFTAEVQGAEPRRRLRVHAAVLDAEHAPDVKAVMGALMGIEAVADAVKQGRLILEADVRCVSDWVYLHAGKRRIRVGEEAAR